MKSLPSELIYGLVFAAILLFQFLMKRFGQPGQQEQQEQQDDGQNELFEKIPDEVKEISTDVSAPGVTVGHFGRNEAQRASPAPAPRRFCRRSLLGTRREVQNAVVIASILGPCRALEPHDSR